jgi:hypothetical protein
MQRAETRCLKGEEICGTTAMRVREQGEEVASETKHCEHSHHPVADVSDHLRSRSGELIHDDALPRVVNSGQSLGTDWCDVSNNVLRMRSKQQNAASRSELVALPALAEPRRVERFGPRSMCRRWTTASGGNWNAVVRRWEG